jgi:3-oxoadipate enol-lactonase
MRSKANGISFNYEVTGKGKNLVLIHAVGDNLNVWYNQVPAFSSHYRVITFDMRGFGKTDSPDGEYSIALLAEDTYALMKAIGVERGYFLGHSLGGRIALELALNHPEMVEALIFANSSPALTPPSKEGPGRLQDTLDRIKQGNIRDLAEMSTATFVAPDFKSKHPDIYEKYVHIKMQNELNGLDRITRATIGSPHTSAPPDLNKIKCPLLLIVGQYDRSIFVEGAKNINQAVPNSQMVTLPTGHAGAIELPDKYNAAILDFLAHINRK